MILFTGMIHPFYVSIIEVEYSSKSKELGVSCKVFPDDLEEALRLFSKKKYDLGSDPKKEIDSVLNLYMQQQLSISINGSKKSLRYLGFENDKESTWIYFTIPKATGVRSIQVDCNLMYAFKEEQTNIIHIKLDDKRQSFKLTAPSTQALLQR
jgi:hypothetical protein